MDIKIGRIYARRGFVKEDIVVVSGMSELDNEEMVHFFYIDDPDEVCVWNYDAFMDGMNELDIDEI